MGLLDQLAGQVLGTLTTGHDSGAAQASPLITLATQLLQHPELGGLSGLVKAFEAKGLGSVVASWIGSGQNLPISADQIMSVLGPALLQKLAQASGNTPEQEAAVVSEALPQLVDRLTPDGQLPGQTDLGSLLGGLAQGLLK